MHRILGALALNLMATAAWAQTAGPVPLGRLPDAVAPLAYRLDLTVRPDQPRFSGHAEIDVTVKAPTASFYLHGRNLNVRSVAARIDGRTEVARYVQVDPTGVARLDFATPLPAGKATLVFDYDAPFGDTLSGFYHVKVGDQWYAWTIFESIDARSAYPGFDEPSHKTPFTVSIAAPEGETAVGNAPEVRATPVAADPAGGTASPAMTRHQFAPTRPLPTYLVAFAVGPFATSTGSVAPTPARPQPLPLRVVATANHKDDMDFALANSARMVPLLENYFGSPFPFPKIDQIASPLMVGGGMENAGAVIYGDDILLVDDKAPTLRKQIFGQTIAHELAHQWFGDLVTPAWWDDIWLNESFADWMGNRIGGQWRPDLRIGEGAAEEAFTAMNIDALQAGRPIHQAVDTSDKIDSTFDRITYGKGGQVVSMVAGYMGDAAFQSGVRLYFQRHAYGTATSADFFRALADAGHDGRIVQAFGSFVNQQGVPLVTVRREGDRMTISQQRYALYGSTPAPIGWTIPFCYSVGGKRACALLDKPSMTVPVASEGLIVPNAGGTGYYRFALPPADWQAMIAAAPTLPPGEALAATDSLWAGFRAGDLPFGLLVDTTRTMANNPYSRAAAQGAIRLEELRAQGMIDAASLPGYRRLIAGVYGPRLAALGSVVKADAYAADDPDRQGLRTTLISILSRRDLDPALADTLAAAAQAWLDGDKAALDPGLYRAGFTAYVARGGVPAAQTLFGRALDAKDPTFRRAALIAIGGARDAAVGSWFASQLDDSRLRLNEKLVAIETLSHDPATREIAYRELLARYALFTQINGVSASHMLGDIALNFCSAEDADRMRRDVLPLVARYRIGDMEFARGIEQARSCGMLRQARSAEIAQALR